jgi:alcohol dehydrogenase (cytochrome c)
MLLRQPFVNRRRQKEPGLDRPEIAHRGNILETRSKRALILSGPPHGVKSDRLLGGVPVGERAAGELYIGVTIDEILCSARFREGVDISKPVDIGQVQAWDLKTGKKVWTQSFADSANWGPLLTTGGDLVFGGGTSDRMFRAFDAKTGKVVWETRLNSGVTGVPSSYMVDGVQYIAVQAGWGVDAERMLGGIATLLPEDRQPSKMAQGGVIWVFALGKEHGKQQAASQ